MTNAQYQIRRAKADSSSILAQLRKLAIRYQRREGTVWQFAIRDILTDLRHLCDIKSLDYAEIDRQAYEGYLTELDWRNDTTDRVG